MGFPLYPPTIHSTDIHFGYRNHLEYPPSPGTMGIACRESMDAQRGESIYDLVFIVLLVGTVVGEK